MGHEWDQPQIRAGGVLPQTLYLPMHPDLDIPTIAVVGAQSAGKSSLIDAIFGITFPRASGTCTR